MRRLSAAMPDSIVHGDPDAALVHRHLSSTEGDGKAALFMPSFFSPWPYTERVCDKGFFCWVMVRHEADTGTALDKMV